MLLRFANFELDPDSRELCCEDRVVALEPKVFDLMHFLLEHRNRFVSKDEILAGVWPDAVTTEGSLSRARLIARDGVETQEARTRRDRADRIEAVLRSGGDRR